MSLQRLSLGATWVSLLVIAPLAGAAQSAAPSQSAASQSAAAAQSAGAPQPAAVQSPEYRRGRLLYIQCRACHELQPGPVEKAGPHLGGIFGRPPAAVPGFNYSAAMRGARLVWDRPTLDRWLERPSAVVPGNSMAFAGIASAADRAALLHYIEIESAPR